MRKRKYTDEQFIQAVRESFSVREALLKLNLIPAGGNYQAFANRVKRLNLNTDHFTGQGYLKNKKHNYKPKRKLEEILTTNTVYKSSSLRRRLINELNVDNKCSICHIKDWQSSPITLHLDHINGIHSDNRLENLRLLCPNCHSQTETYCVKNRKQYPTTEHSCLKCNAKLLQKRKTGMCIKCCRDGRIRTDKPFLAASFKPAV